MSDSVPSRPAVPPAARPVAAAPVPPVARPAAPAAVPGVTKPAVKPSSVPPAVTATAPFVAAKPANVGSGQVSGKPAFSAKVAETPHGKKQFLFDLLDDCGANGVSDLHVHPGKGMWRLTSGKLAHFEDPATDIITEEEIIHWIEHCDGYEDMNVDDPEKLLGEKGHTTVAFDTGTWRVRGSFRRSTVGISCTFRLIPSKIPTIEDVYLPEVMVAMIRRSSGLILIEGPTGSGKGSPVWERILTPEGWTTYGDIKVGDTVVGSDGNPTKVTGVFPRGELPVFKVTFNDGSHVTVDGDHLWAVQTREQRIKQGVRQSVFSTSELISKGVLDNEGHSKWFIPMVEPVQFDSAELLPLHPYVLGALLGDGSFADGSVTFTSHDPEIAARIGELLPDKATIKLLDKAPSRQGKSPHYHLGGSEWHKNPTKDAVRELGLLGTKSATKFVPEQYLWADVANRVELLRGLMDTDGGMSGESVEFSSVSENLADSVVFLVQSLGGTAKKSARVTSYTNSAGEKVNGQVSYRVRVKLPADFNPFWVSRKAEAWVAPTKYRVTRAIRSIEPAGTGDVVCISVEAEDSLYVADNFIVTHNTTSIAALIDYINKNTDLHIYSIEDPIEFYHKPIGSTVFTMREIGVHASDYPSAVENALRSKPNIIFIGEMLNNQTKKSALHASTTGHLVISTAHAGSVTEALDSFIGEFSAEEQPQIRGRLAQSLLGVMCQSLVPTKDGKLVAAREVMLSNVNFSEIIRTGEMNMLHAQMASSPGCFTMEDSLIDLAARGIIDPKVAVERAKNPEVVQDELARRNIFV